MNLIRSFKNSMVYALVFGTVGAAGAMAAVLLASPFDELVKNWVVGLVAAIAAVYMVLFFVGAHATRQYNEILALLYHDLDPEAFLARAEPFLQNKMEASQRVNTIVHVANGYLAAGKPVIALEKLNALEVPDTALELRGLISANRTSCYLDMNKPNEAKKSMKETLRITQHPKCKKEFVTKARHTMGFQQLHLEVLEGKTAPREELEKDFETSRSPLHKARVAGLLLKIYRQMGEEAKFNETRAWVLKNGKGLAAVKTAEKATL